MISLIMRVHGIRLQYTVAAIEALARQVNAPPFEVIVVDNGSTDGTEQWFEAIQRDEGTRTWFPTIKYVPAPTIMSARGDWTGMVRGVNQVDPSSRYIGQLDNDIVLPPRALQVTAHLLDAKQADVLMLKRRGVRQALEGCGRTKNVVVEIPEVKFCPSDPTDSDLKVAIMQPVPFCVAFWLTRAKHFKEAGRFQNCREFTKAVGGCWKILDRDLQAVHQEGWNENPQEGEVPYIQKRKYNYDLWKSAMARGLM